MPGQNQLTPQTIAKWKEIIYLGKKSNYFLVFALPILHRIENTLKSSLKRYPKIIHWLDSDFLDNLIYMQAETIILPIILRSCVLEMHVARRHHLLKGKTSAERFTYFIKVLADEENREALLQKYPIMRQKLELVCRQLIDVFQELFKRLNRDYQELNTLFFKGQGNYLQLTQIKASGDRHQGGREVLILGFENKTKPASKIKLVYKPHSLKIDSAFQQFLEQFNACSGSLALKTLRILDKSPSLHKVAGSHLYKNPFLNAYGYCEFMDIRPCRNSNEVANFYFRLGMLFMLSYLFLGCDLHSENLLAQGEYPLLVDYECLLTPWTGYTKPGKKHKMDRHLVLHMHLLPYKEATDTPNVYLDFSGINSSEDLKVLRRSWVNIGKDTMKIKQLQKTLPKIGNRPQLKGKVVSVSAYENEFINGFKTAYQVILEKSSTLLDTKGVLKAFKKARVRILSRATELYAILLEEQHFPQNLLNQKSNRSQLDKLDVIKKILPGFKAFIPSEKADLLAETIPIFYAISDEPAIYNSQGQALKLYSKSGYEVFQEHLSQNICLKDMQQQVELIQASFLANRLNNKPETGTRSPDNKIPQQLNPLWSAAKQKNEAIKLATKILNNLMDRALYSAGTIFWPYFDVIGKEMYAIGMTAEDLYDGISGILLPFAYAGQLLQVKSYQTMSQECINAIRHRLQPPLSPTLSLGFTSGIGGILYVFRLLQSLGYSVSIKKDLKPLFDFFLKPKHIEKDHTFDLIDGVTGGLVGCLAWHRHLPEDMVLPAIKNCVQHVVDNYPDPAILPQDFKGSASQPLLGLAHGVTGMILVLSHCNAILKDSRLDLWIKKAIDYERAQFKLHEEIWPDYRLDPENESEVVLPVDTKEHQMVAWCTGPAGIGLAKMATLAPYKDRQFTNEIRTAADQLLASGLTNEDFLCHGNLGNLELLVALARHTKNVQDIRNAQGFAQATCLHIAEKMQKTEDRPIMPGLFKGDAGIAYGLLRIAFPDKIPNILLPTRRYWDQ